MISDVSISISRCGSLPPPPLLSVSLPPADQFSPLPCHHPYHRVPAPFHSESFILRDCIWRKWFPTGEFSTLSFMFRFIFPGRRFECFDAVERCGAWLSAELEWNRVLSRRVEWMLILVSSYCKAVRIGYPPNDHHAATILVISPSHFSDWSISFPREWYYLVFIGFASQEVVADEYAAPRSARIVFENVINTRSKPYNRKWKRITNVRIDYY